MTGAELKKLVKDYVEGTTGGIKPFNRGSLTTVSGISIEVSETSEVTVRFLGHIPVL